MSKRKKAPRPPERAPFNPKHYYGRCDACMGFGFFYLVVESRRRDPDNPGLTMRRRRMDTTSCHTCCGVGSVVKPGPIELAKGGEHTVPTIVEYV